MQSVKWYCLLLDRAEKLWPALTNFDLFFDKHNRLQWEGNKTRGLLRQNYCEAQIK